MGTVVEMREGAHAMAAKLRKEGNLTLAETRAMLRAVRSHKKALETVERYLLAGSCRVAGLERRVHALADPMAEVVVTLAQVQKWR